MSLHSNWSNDSIPQLNPLASSSKDLDRPRKHARRTSLPASRGQASTSQHNGSNGLDGHDSTLASYNAERRKFRESLHSGRRIDGSSSTSKRRSSAPGTSNEKIRRENRVPSVHVEEVEGDDEDDTDDLTSAVQSSTTYAAGPSEGGRLLDDTSSSDASSSERLAFDWDIARKRNAPFSGHPLLFKPKRSSSVDERRAKRRSLQASGTRGDSSVPDTPPARKRDLPDVGDDSPRANTTALARSTQTAHLRTNGNTSPGSATRFSPTGQEIATAKRTLKLTKQRVFGSSALEAAMLIAGGIYTCYRLLTYSDSSIQQHVYELAFVVISSALYHLLHSPDENGAIWATDERNYRPCGDDGAICGLLLGPLLAATCLFTSLAEIPSQRLASGDSLPFPPWRIEAPPHILGSRTIQHASLSALALSRCSLLSLQTVTSTTLLCHLMATKWIRSPNDFPKSNWKRLGSFIKFSIIVTSLLVLAREAFVAFNIPIWIDLTRSEIIISSLFFQSNLYTISRLARKSFTLGELGIVATVGVTLCLETLNLTSAKLLPGTTPYVKTFRRPTPLLIFQLALVVGTFMIGFLLSPLLYLSRHLAQKPVHRLRWPHKRDLHRRLLAGFFYFFAALDVIGVLGFWVWWMLGNRNPWLWTLNFILEGSHWWTRPLLIFHWLTLVGLSISLWQATMLTGKRLRIRPAGASVNGGQQSSIAPSRLKGKAVTASPNESAVEGSAKAKQKGGVPGGAEGDHAQANGSLGLPKKAAHLSLNARRKSFHALAVLLFAPGIAYDPAFSHLAFSLAFSAFIFAEYIRYYALYPFGAALHVFMSEFTDHKDCGPVILSHFYLLTGCASAIWIEGVRKGAVPAVSTNSGTGFWPWKVIETVADPERSVGHVDIVMFIGVLTLGVGDALASIVGRRYGRLYWPRSSKTFEGSLAFVTSIYASALFLRAIGWCAPFPLGRFGAVTVVLGILEGASNQNDNLVLPIFAFIALSLFEV